MDKTLTSTRTRIAKGLQPTRQHSRSQSSKVRQPQSNQRPVKRSQRAYARQISGSSRPSRCSFTRMRIVAWGSRQRRGRESCKSSGTSRRSDEIKRTNGSGGSGTKPSANRWPPASKRGQRRSSLSVPWSQSRATLSSLDSAIGIANHSHSTIFTRQCLMARSKYRESSSSSPMSSKCSAARTLSLTPSTTNTRSSSESYASAARSATTCRRRRTDSC